MKPYEEGGVCHSLAWCTCKRCMRSSSYKLSGAYKAERKLGRSRARAEGKSQCLEAA